MIAMIGLMSSATDRGPAAGTRRNTFRYGSVASSMNPIAARSVRL